MLQQQNQSRGQRQERQDQEIIFFSPSLRPQLQTLMVRAASTAQASKWVQSDRMGPLCPSHMLAPPGA